MTDSPDSNVQRIIKLIGSLCVKNAEEMSDLIIAEMEKAGLMTRSDMAISMAELCVQLGLWRKAVRDALKKTLGPKEYASIAPLLGDCKGPVTTPPPPPEMYA